MASSVGRKYRRMDDWETLHLFQAGYFRLKRAYLAGGDEEAIEIALIISPRGKMLRTRRCHGGYHFVRLYFDGACREIALHKLLWMIHHNRPLPAGFELHHTKTLDHNLPADLELLTEDEHKRQHGKCQTPF